MSETLGRDARFEDLAPRKRRKPPGSLVDDPLALADALYDATGVLLSQMRPLERLEGVSGPAIWALHHVSIAPGITPSDIATREQVSLPTVARAVRELEDAGLVERRPDPEDRRTQRLYATTAGHRRLKDGRRRRVSRLAVVLQRLQTDDRDALARATELLRALGEM